MFKNIYPKQIKLKLTKTRHLICQSRINGVKAILLIDTGASNSCISHAEKENFNIEENGEPFEASGAGQDKLKAVLGHQCDLILGRHAVGKHAFVLLDMQHINATLVNEKTKPIDGILGGDFLSEKKAVIDYKKMCMFLNN